MTMTFGGADRLQTIQQCADLTTVSFDASGNQTGENLSGELTTNTFDRENRLIGVVQAEIGLRQYEPVPYGGADRHHVRGHGPGLRTTSGGGSLFARLLGAGASNRRAEALLRSGPNP